MSFAHPLVLVALLLPLASAWLVARWRRGAHRVRMPYDHAARRGRRPVSALLGIAQAAPAVTLAAAVAMLAFPQRQGEVKSIRDLTNIQIVLDVSGSMGPAFEIPTRYSYASAAIERFTLAREGDAMGLIIFGMQQVRWIPITTDLEAIRLALPYADPERQPYHMQGTAIGAALRFAAKAMAHDAAQDGDRVIVLISDGVSGDIGGGRHHATAQDLIDAGVRLYYLHVGRDAHEQGAMEIASLTGGRGFIAEDARATAAVFEQLDRMMPSVFEHLQPERFEMFRPFASLGLWACLVQLIGLLWLRYTPW